MRVEVFDDWKSLVHLLLGASSLFLPWVVAIFLGYELVEFCYKRKRRREKIGEFIGDFIEFLVGAGVAALSLPLFAYVLF